jgi:hypothetical protein
LFRAATISDDDPKAAIEHEEIDMMLHLPVAILVALSPVGVSPVAVSDIVPRFDIVKECQLEGGSATVYQQCLQDEAAALSRLGTEWPQFGRPTQTMCRSATTSGGVASYVELMTCLEMTRDVASANHDVGRAAAERPPAQPGRPATTVGEGH